MAYEEKEYQCEECGRIVHIDELAHTTICPDCGSNQLYLIENNDDK